MTTMVQTGYWFGALDLPWHGGLLSHVVSDDAQRHDYPPDVGGLWAYAKCGDPAYFYEDGTAAAKRVPPCPTCHA